MKRIDFALHDFCKIIDWKFITCSELRNIFNVDINNTILYCDNCKSRKISFKELKEKLPSEIIKNYLYRRLMWE